MRKSPDADVAAVLMVYRALQSRPGRLISETELFSEGAKLELSAATLASSAKRGLAVGFLGNGGDGLIELRRAGFAAMMRLPPLKLAQK